MLAISAVAELLVIHIERFQRGQCFHVLLLFMVHCISCIGCVELYVEITHVIQ